MYDLIIIGGGPAGVTAGIYAARKRMKTLLVTKDFIGQTGEAGIIENWPGDIKVTGPELMNRFEDHLRLHEIEIIEDEIVSVEKSEREEENFIVKTEDEEFEGRTVIVATGRKPRPLGVSGEEEYVGKGVVYCTTCDAPTYKNKKVVVVGGGNSGFEAAIEMKDYTDDVCIFEESDNLHADKILIDRAEKNGIEVFKRRKVVEIKGGDFLEEVIYEDLETGEQKTFEADGVFVKIGSVPAADFVKNLVEIYGNGDIKLDPVSCATKTKGLFAAGDVSNVRDKQIITAAAEGSKAALSVYDFLKNN